ncbi:NTP pyrophosphohydrolase [Streptomyces atratus]
MLSKPTLLIVDAANVVGSVPDGWWRDRRAAAVRLRDSLVPFAADGLDSFPGRAELILVVEGAARGIESLPGVRVESAPGSGDDRIVELVADAMSRPQARICVVVTADRGLRQRVEAYGAQCVGPRAVRPPPPSRSD